MCVFLVFCRGFGPFCSALCAQDVQECLAHSRCSICISSRAEQLFRITHWQEHPSLGFCCGSAICDWRGRREAALERAFQQESIASMQPHSDSFTGFKHNIPSLNVQIIEIVSLKGNGLRGVNHTPNIVLFVPR